MKVINVASAKSVWLFDINDLNPRGKDIMPELLEWLKDNYHFDKAPTSLDQLDDTTKALKFERGRFMIKEEIYITVGLEIYKDGVVAQSNSSTRDSETFVEDVLSFTAKEFSLPYDPEMIKAKLQTSELIIRLDSPLSNINPKLAAFAAKLASTCGYRDIPSFELSGIGFGNDPMRSRLKLAGFTVERQNGTEYADNRFYSKAPVHTDQHEELLGEFERLLVP
jgi:hypothetical protein